MGEMTGGLIQMNTHMVMTKGATTLIAIGVIMACFFAIIACKLWVASKIKASLVFMGVAAIGILLIYAGTKQPRVKEIKSCVYGPVSLEQVAVVYDIVNVDGKELTLRER